MIGMKPESSDAHAINWRDLATLPRSCILEAEMKPITEAIVRRVMIAYGVIHDDDVGQAL